MLTLFIMAKCLPMCDNTLQKLGEGSELQMGPLDVESADDFLRATALRHRCRLFHLLVLSITNGSVSCQALHSTTDAQSLSCDLHARCVRQRVQCFQACCCCQSGVRKWAWPAACRSANSTSRSLGSVRSRRHLDLGSQAQSSNV